MLRHYRLTEHRLHPSLTVPIQPFRAARRPLRL
jgi:hypothetical protein